MNIPNIEELKRKYVRVIWRDISGIDSADNSSSWFTKKQLLAKGQELFEHEYITIGEIIVDTKDFIVIGATTDNDKEEPLYSDVSMIPKAVVIRQEDL
jgi:hypothetical protein